MIARWLALALIVCCATFARAGSLDDAMARFQLDRFPETAKAIGELVASGAPNAAVILDALGDNRLLIDQGSHLLLYESTSGDVYNARTNEKLSGVDASSFKTVRVNNALRSAIDAAVGSLTLANPDPQKRIEAAEAVFKSRDAKALPALEAQLARETDARAKSALEFARAAIIVGDSSALLPERLAAVATLKGRADRDSESLLGAVVDQATTPELEAAAQSALASIKSTLALWELVQNVWYGVSASSVLLLAAIGLAITFGVMGVINMAHGEMVMLGAYSTYVVQSLLPGSLSQWSLAISLPVAFVVSGVVGVVIERFVIRFLYGRPLETLLATWGVSLILQQAVRSIFGASNRQVTTPDFMSGSFRLGGLSIESGRLWIIALSILVFIALQVVLRLTPFGLRMRAVTQNRRMASAMGISTDFIDMLAFALGSGIAGIAGVALSQIDNVSPNLGQGYIIDSFMVVVLGGVGNLWGTLLGAVTLGLANKLMEPFIGAVLGKILLLVFIILFIQKRPRGLFALKGRAVEA
ncbi:MAG: urea ABC transporter permease subunit UrtB [Roseiarcus sp.]